MVLGALVMIVIAFSYAYMVPKYPKAGGEFFGQTGSFEQGWAADFLITDVPSYQQERTVDEQLQYFIYHGTAQDIREVYVNGLAVKK